MIAAVVLHVAASPDMQHLIPLCKNSSGEPQSLCIPARRTECGGTVD